VCACAGGYARRGTVWSTDGRLLQNFEDFATSVTGLCYCEVTRHLWATCSCGRPYVYDLHSGSNITEVRLTRTCSFASHFLMHI